MFFTSKEIATTWHSIGNGILLLSLIGGVIGTYISLWTGSIKEEYLKAELAEVNDSAAEALREAEIAKLERTKLEADLAPRIVTTTEETLADLRIFSGVGVLIQFESYDIEALRLAGQIGNMLESADWNVLGLVPVSPGIPGFEITAGNSRILSGMGGVEIYSSLLIENPLIKDDNLWNAAAKILNIQLSENKIETVEFALSSSSDVFPDNFPNEAILVVVRTKPQPYFTDKQINSMAGTTDEDKQERERQLEEDIKKIPSLLPLLEESRQRKESIVDTWKRHCRRQDMELKKMDRQMIVQKYK